jgi:hypothetical protein
LDKVLKTKVSPVRGSFHMSGKPDSLYHNVLYRKAPTQYQREVN